MVKAQVLPAISSSFVRPGSIYVFTGDGGATPARDQGLGKRPRTSPAPGAASEPSGEQLPPGSGDVVGSDRQ